MEMWCVRKRVRDWWRVRMWRWIVLVVVRDRSVALNAV